MSSRNSGLRQPYFSKQLYQIGIRCLAATNTKKGAKYENYIRLELDV